MTDSSIDLLSAGLLTQFSSLKEIEKLLDQLLAKQNEMLQKDIKTLNFYESEEQTAEISLMVSWSTMEHSLC